MVVAHGGSPRAGQYVTAGKRHARPDPHHGLKLQGYRHFLREPEDAERCGLFATEAEREKQIPMLHRLSKAMQPVEYKLRENRNLPSGYTYLLQLVAHDCVHTPTPFWQLPPAHAEARNQRAERLRLDTIYGDGPIACPYAYAPDDDSDITRTKLRLGPMSDRRPGPVAPTKMRDLARASLPGEEVKGKPVFADPMIHDPRNEDNSLTAQITVLWHMVHNSLVDIAGLPRGAALQEHAREPVFIWARAATMMIYRRILRKDVLRRLLDPTIYERYLKAGPADLLDRDPDPDRFALSVPLEFSHGAMRFAHAMIRPSYEITGGFIRGIDEALRATSARGPRTMPLTRDWIVQWGKFFEVPDEKGTTATEPKNLGLCIQPVYSPPLHSSALFPGVPNTSGLALLDMMSAGAARMWSVSALHAAIIERAGKLKNPWLKPFEGVNLARDAPRAKAITTWLEANANQYDAFSPDEVKMLANDPPLPFYVQFEALKQHRGCRLGMLGSILVAEAMFGTMLADPLPHETVDGSLVQGLQQLAKELDVKIRRKGDLPELDDMGGLVRFVARIQGLGSAEPPFI
jgi:hypothetical protein